MVRQVWREGLQGSGRGRAGVPHPGGASLQLLSDAGVPLTPFLGALLRSLSPALPVEHGANPLASLPASATQQRALEQAWP